MSLLTVFQWLDRTALGNDIRMSTYLFPAIEVVHLIGLVLLLGTVIVVDLRLLGLGLRRQTVTRVAEEVAPWTLLGLSLAVATGSLLLLSEAVKCYQNDAFWLKMEFLLPALIFHFTVYRKVTSSDKIPAIWSKLTGCLSLLLWFGVGLGGRAIAFA